MENSVQKLKAGNARFVSNSPKEKDNVALREKTSVEGQKPFAAVLSCIDSRSIAEVVFDSDIGDFFNVRIAGNIVTNEIIASLEFATAVVGAELILVLGHTQCGAIDAALSGAEVPGHLNTVISKIKFNDNPVEDNVNNSIEQIVTRSSVISDLIEQGKVSVCGAVHELKSGEVTFL